VDGSSTEVRERRRARNRRRIVELRIVLGQHAFAHDGSCLRSCVCVVGFDRLSVVDLLSINAERRLGGGGGALRRGDDATSANAADLGRGVDGALAGRLALSAPRTER
jgi:hypothetical protein